MTEKMIILGLTGGIGTGKSTVGKILGSWGHPVYSADEAVHRLMGKNGKAFMAIKKEFPKAIEKGVVNRGTLGEIVFSNRRELKKLEAILHPLVHQEETLFLKVARRQHARLAILEIPLLFETKAHLRCDGVLVTTAPRAVQQKRVLLRKGMTVEKFRSILREQMPESEKKKRADYVVHTGKSLFETRRQLKKILHKLLDA